MLYVSKILVIHLRSFQSTRAITDGVPCRPPPPSRLHSRRSPTCSPAWCSSRVSRRSRRCMSAAAGTACTWVRTSRSPRSRSRPTWSGPAACAIYRTASALNALLEHANFRVPGWLDRALSLVTTWPCFHKVHHSRSPELTNTNYGNLFSVWDRLFGTYTPSQRGRNVHYGLDELDRPELQSATALLVAPFRSGADQPSFAITSSAKRRSPSRLSASER